MTGNNFFACKSYLPIWRDCRISFTCTISVNLFYLHKPSLLVKKILFSLLIVLCDDLSDFGELCLLVLFSFMLQALLLLIYLRNTLSTPWYKARAMAWSELLLLSETRFLCCPACYPCLHMQVLPCVQGSSFQSLRINNQIN